MGARPDRFDVVIVGAGVSGLVAALALEKRGLTVAVLDAGAAAGGVIASRERDGFLFETGANSTLDTTPLLDQLFDDVGIRGERVDAGAVASIRYIVRGGRLVALPTSPGAFVTTSAFTLGAKLRLFREPFIAPSPPEAEESIAAFVRRRLGTEFLDYAIDPFVSGVYAGDPEEISVPAAFPRLFALEQKYGSLIRGQILGARERRNDPETSKRSAKSFSFKGGMGTLPLAIAHRLAHFVAGMDVRSVVRTAEGYDVQGVRNGVPATFAGRAVVLATPAYVTARIVGPLAPAASRALAAIEYAPIAVVVTAYRREDVGHDLAGFGFLVPRKERRRILGSLFSSSMFAGRAPAGHVLLTTFAGGRRSPDMVALADADLARAVRDELGALVGASEPRWTEIVRWTHAIPQYTLGHRERIAGVDAASAALPGLFYCASWRGGVSVGDCVKSANALAATVAGLVSPPACAA